MQSFANKLAVISGGGSGMGRQLVLQLAKAGASSAFCDVHPKAIDETVRLAKEVNPNVRVTGHIADVTKESDWLRFRDETLKAHDRDHVNLAFMNAGIGGGGSFIKSSREEWDRTFDICWNGVLHGSRTFLPLLIAAKEGWLVNTSSVNGFHAVLSIGNGIPHTAYSAAKFAVKGFSEALIYDLRENAPHVGVSVVMPGHIGTKVVSNSASVLGQDLPFAGLAEAFENQAPTTAAQAATIILDGVKAGKWRILVGPDAHFYDNEVRAHPEQAYDPEFYANLVKHGMTVRV